MLVSFFLTYKTAVRDVYQYQKGWVFGKLRNCPWYEYEYSETGKRISFLQSRVQRREQEYLSLSLVLRNGNEKVSNQSRASRREQEMISQDRARKIKLSLMRIPAIVFRWVFWLPIKVWRFCDVCFLLDLVKAGDAGWDSLQMIYRASSRAKRWM